MKKQSVFAAFARCIGYALLFVAAQVLASIVAEGVILAVILANGTDLASLQEDTLWKISGSLTYEIMLLSALLFLGIAAMIHRRESGKLAGFRRTPPAGVFSGLFLGFAAYLGATVLISVTYLIPAVQESQNEYMEQYEAILSANPSLVTELLYVCLIGPLVEEILCRGMIQNTLKKSFTPGAAIFFSALFFAIIHGNLYQIVFTLPLGLLLGWIAHRFDSIWPAFALHAAFNLSNYPVQICLKLGYGEESKITLFCSLASTLFCLISIPLGLILLRHALRKKAPPAPVFTTVPKHSGNPYGYGWAPTNQNSTATNGGDPMAAPEYLVVGLGNPGDKYAANRHNVGFMALDYIALRENIQLNNLRFKALTGEALIGGKKVLFLKPQTFMNLSGEAVREAAAFYKIPPERILVIFDDINFAPGIFRIRSQGSAGGHNGIKSIISCLGSDAFSRVKVGVGNPPAGWELMNWVLGNPSPEDQKKIIASMEDIYSTVKLFTVNNLDHAAGLYNGKMHE